MDRTQAEEIQKHLLDAVSAIDRASKVIFDLNKDDREPLAAPLGEIASALHFDLLQAIYNRYPELKPPAEPAVIGSALRWDDIVLPGSVSEADIDQIIFSVLNLQWRKTAMVVGNALTRCRQLDLPISAEMLGARVQALAESDRLESQGDLRKWRHSEVRLRR
jgi:hypothetical protein